MPSLQDGGVLWSAVSPGFTRGYFHSLPLGAQCVLDLWRELTGFSSGHFQWLPPEAPLCTL